MAIQSFLKAEKGDPDWAFTPEHYIGKEFKIIEASHLDLPRGKKEQITLRQSPIEKELLAKHLRIEIREDAELDLTIINEATTSLQQVFIYDIHIRDGGYLNMGVFAKGGKLNKHIIQVNIENFASFNLYGHSMNNVGGDCEIITKIDHQGSTSVSNQLFTCEAGKNSQTVFQGMVYVFNESERVTVGIDVTNLITEMGGKCQSVPQITNNNDTARISSGTSTNFLDQDQIYYLQIRGIDELRAEKLLINKHRSRSLDIITNKEIRDEVNQLLG